MNLHKFPFISICLASAAFLFVFVREADAAKLFLYPDPVEIPAGQTGLVEVRLDTEGESVNAAQVVVSVPPSLSVREVLVGGSVLPLTPEAPFVGVDTVKIVGGAPSGYEGSGILARIILGAASGARADAAELSFDDRSMVLLNDGKATPARLTTRPAQVTLLAAGAILLRSTTHPDQTKWYNQRVFSVSWDVVEGAQYSYQISRDAFAVPDDLPDTPVGDIQLATLEDGIYYFSLREIPRNLTQNNAKEVSRWRVMVDVTRPEPFEVLVTKQPDVYGGDFWYAVFIPTDALSGVAKVEVAEVRGKPFDGAQGEEAQWYEAAAPYALRFQDRSAKILVRATDEAGNTREVAVEPEPSAPSWLPWLGALLAVVVVVFLFQQRRKRREEGIIESPAGNP